MKDLKDIRKELDQIDSGILALFEQRMKLNQAVAEYKISTGKPVLDKAREKEKLESLKNMAAEENEQGVRELFTLIMSAGRRLQYKILTENGRGIRFPFIPVETLIQADTRVVFQGVEGAYSHAATLQYFGEGMNAYHVTTFEDAMKAVSQGEADYAVLPIENSSAGMVTDVYDLLVNYDNYIVGETFVKVNHALLALPQASMADIKTVYSHPQGIMQSAKFLDQHRDWQVVRLENTAVSAKKVWEDQDISKAAIASEIAGDLYGLKTLQKPVNHEMNNTTRFIIVSGLKVFLKSAKKISICFETAHESGSLYNILSNFIYNHINMTKIESRPIPGRTWEYRFFVEFEGNLDESEVRNALKGISEEAITLKILGNY